MPSKREPQEQIDALNAAVFYSPGPTFYSSTPTRWRAMMSEARKSTGTVADYTMLTDYADHIPRKRPEEVTDMKRRLTEANIRADRGDKMKDRWCPKARFHTRQPTGYVQWHEWAEQKSRRHYQVRCPGCGLFSIWKRKCESGQETEQ